MSTQIVQVPDIGADTAEVIEILVSVGDEVEVDQSLAVLESDKASVEIPCPLSGKVISVAINVGDQVSEGTQVVELEVAGDNSESTSVSEPPESEDEQRAEENPIESTKEGSSVDSQVQESTVCLLPDIGADEAEIIEVVVAVGDSVEEGDSIVVAESDKASVEVPAEFSGVVEALHVSTGDKVSQGGQLVTIAHVAAGSAPEPNEPTPQQTEPPVLEDVVESSSSVEPEAKTYAVPDIGSDSAEVIEILVATGDEVAEGDSICAIETDKASVEIPSPVTGRIEELYIATGDQISEGQDFVRIIGAAVASASSTSAETVAEKAVAQNKASPEKIAAQTTVTQSAATAANSAHVDGSNANIYAGPAARKHARELGVELSDVKGSGNRGRILIDDINQFVKHRMQSGGASLEAGQGRGLPEIPAVDWAKFGEIEIEPMSRIHKATAANMVRNWLNVPHVTQFDDADVSELEKYRAYLKAEATSRGIKMTPVAFLLKAAAVALTENPKMNSSLHQNGEDLVFRKFVHISIAVDTPAGLMVPVIRDVDKKNIWELAADVSVMATKAKDGKLGAKDMQGASFTISSLGAIGGTGFTPIVPAPQVAILGVSKTSIKPIWNGSEFIPRQMMPLSVSYDHRAVNGADAGKFMTSLVAVLEDLDRIWNG